MLGQRGTGTSVMSGGSVSGVDPAHNSVSDSEFLTSFPKEGDSDPRVMICALSPFKHLGMSLL